MKILMLDLDGVVRINGNFSRAAIKNLNKLLQKMPELEIVISSNWRNKGLDYVKDLLMSNGVDPERIIDATDTKYEESRGKHIERWIDHHKEVLKSFVIFDDSKDMDNVKDHWVKVNPFIGITESDVKKALDILEK